MNIFILLLVPIVVYYIAIRFYSKWIARQLGESPEHQTPAVKFNDGRDFCPTRLSVVFAGHFSGIAGAGPILGPVMAILYGVAPAWLWIIIGGTLFGAVHDYTTLFVSLQEGGRSIAEICRRTLGNATYGFFVFFLLLLLTLINSSFLSTTATALTSRWPIDKIPNFAASDFQILYIDIVDGVPMAHIGGIASTSVVFITCVAPLLGLLLRKTNMRTVYIYTIAALLCVASVILGIFFPIRVESSTWMYIISGYTLLAAGLPIWLIIQPRDFINVQILYAGVILIISSMCVLLFKGDSHLSFPLWDIACGNKYMGHIWPILFITIACGAISGFHSILGTGTTSKLIKRETHARVVGYGGMILESFLAVCALLIVAYGLTRSDYMAIIWPDTGSGNPILAFSLGAAQIFNKALGIPVQLATVLAILLLEGFVVTTLDVAVRLTRLLLEEFWNALFNGKQPKFLRVPWFNSTIAVLCMLGLAANNTFNTLWPIFGTANQLLAALALTVVLFWLILRRKSYLYVLLPAIFMGATTMASLCSLIPKYIENHNWPLLITAILLITVSVIIVLRGTIDYCASRKKEQMQQ